MTGPAAGSLGPRVRAALAEDVGSGDVTTAATVPSGARGRARIVARAEGVIAGLGAAEEVYRQVDPAIRFAAALANGAVVGPGAVVATAEGSFAGLLIAERTALNFLQRLSGIATLTARFVNAVAGRGARIVDTRKTTPGWRDLEKAAVRAGGGVNHRLGLYDAYLVKENHITAAGGISAAMDDVHGGNTRGLPVEIEVRSLAELDLVLEARPAPDRILLDNFDISDLDSGVARIRAASPGTIIEASGNVNLETAAAIAGTGVDWISVGGLTHSAPSLDLSCLIDPA